MLPPPPPPPSLGGGTWLSVERASSTCSDRIHLTRYERFWRPRGGWGVRAWSRRGPDRLQGSAQSGHQQPAGGAARKTHKTVPLLVSGSRPGPDRVQAGSGLGLDQVQVGSGPDFQVPSRSVMCLAPLPQQLLVRCSPLSHLELRIYAFSAFCEVKRNFDAEKCTLCCKECCQSTTDS